MYRRRLRRERELFSFDSFLDVVANVVGIIIRLILVAWVGARAYRAIVPDVELPPPPVLAEQAPLPPVTDPRVPLLDRTREEIARAREEAARRERDLLALRASRPDLEAELASLASREKELAAQREALQSATGAKGQAARAATLSAEELQARSRKLLADMEALRKAPVRKKELRYRTPVSRPLQTDEVMFECSRGRVTLIDTGALLERVKKVLREKGELLRDRWEVRETTEAVGAFRLRYVVERERTSTDGPGSPSDGPYRFGLAGWMVEPIVDDRGEGADQALVDGSAFRRITDALDPQQTAVTLWVYPDSFELYRKLRDFLHDRDVTVAGRPLPSGAPVASSKRGTVSRGQ